MSTNEDMSKDTHTGPSKMTGSAKEATQDGTPLADTLSKRKASSPVPSDDATPHSPKRAKITESSSKAADDQPTSHSPITRKSPGVDRREIARQEERKRGRRLFGGLMNTLSQAGAAGSQNRKRQEVERRQQAKTAQQRDDEYRQRMEDRAKLAETRAIEQIYFEEQVMRAKHRDLLSKARFLKTKARPPIYYQPYKLTRSQEEQVKDQIEEAEKLIEEELARFKDRKERRLTELGVSVKPTSPKEEKRDHPMVGKPREEHQPTNKQHSTTNTSTRPRSSSSSHAAATKEKESADRAEDVMIEEDEDTVIY
ncbi:hypothetical protein F5Y16DRAFT_385486 [Xylariaceae sp. FL0255]|nr:hypothetical protein F5Y16DRAFT_385486 [Xylariaceae sp. FL0255]